MYIQSVSSLNEQIKALLEESFSRVLVQGELSRVTYHSSRHVYFTLKDEASTIKAVIFKTNAQKLKFELCEGLQVILDGTLSLYKPRGEYQITCFNIEPAGHGALALAFEQLKQKLSSKGYFDQSIKKQLPKFPKKIALITSSTGAALQDMLRVANSRYRLLEIDVYDVLVQGQNASFDISRALSQADKKDYDIIIMGRGGGSIEDLWAFNEEIVADAIFMAKTPIVSAVGHEIDWVISDFVSDLRAPTPSAAMQMCLPDTGELLQYLDSIAFSYEQRVLQKILTLKQELLHAKSMFEQNSVEKKIKQRGELLLGFKSSFNQNIYFKLQNLSKELLGIKNNFPHLIDSKINIAQNQLSSLLKMIESNHPKHKSKRGFVQISKESKVVEISSLKVDDIFDLMSDEIKLSAKVIKKSNTRGSK